MKKSLFSIFFYTALLSLVAFSQQSPSESENSYRDADQRHEEIEQFVDDLIRQIESSIDNFSERRRVQSYGDDDEEQQKDSSSKQVITFNGDTEIAATDTVHGDLVVKNGTLTIRGTIIGDVLVVNGDIRITGTARIAGNARAMNGTVSKDDGAIVEGYTEESGKNVVDRKKKTSRARYSYSFKPNTWYNLDGEDNVLFRYNRVEGFFFGFGSSKQYYWDGSRSLSGFGSFGYGFASHKWRLQLGLDRQFATGSGLYEIGAEVHSLTDTKDEWIMNLSENNLAALFFHEDFRDYYQREGFSAHTARYTKDGDVSTMIDARYTVDRYASLSQNAHWSLFGGRTFRFNPAVNEGMLRSVSIRAGLSTVERYRRHVQGWDIFAGGEYGGNQLGGDFDFTHAIVDVRRYQSISDYDRISARVRVGSLEGMPIAQRIFELGGANTMPAFGFKEFVGNRMVLGNLEYQLHGDLLDEIFLWPSFLAVTVFGDAGAVVNVPQKYAVFEGFDAVSVSTFKSDVGFSLGTNNGDARIGFAWRTDKSAPVAVFFRLNKAF